MEPQTLQVGWSSCVGVSTVSGCPLPYFFLIFEKYLFSSEKTSIFLMTKEQRTVASFHIMIAVRNFSHIAKRETSQHIMLVRSK